MAMNVAIYTRVSSAKQKEGDNIQSQISSLVEYANQRGYNIPNGWVFSDEGYSGATLNRPALDTLREIIQEDVVDAVLVYSPDRLSRKYAYQILLEMEFQKRGVEIIFFNTPKATSPEEQLSVHFKGVFAEYERAQIAERCRRGRLYRAKQGSVSVMPQPSFGYDYIKKTETTLAQYIINNRDAAIVKEIFRLYVEEHLSLHKICFELGKRGILSPKGCKKRSHTTVRDIIKNEAYIGTAHYGKTVLVEGSLGKLLRKKNGSRSCVPLRRKMDKPKELWIPISVPQIISEVDFEMAQAKIQRNIVTASRNTIIPSILQGLMVCGYCGSPFYKKSRTSKHVYYNCSKRQKSEGCNAPSVKQEELDNLVWTHVIELLKNPILIEEEMNRRIKEVQDSEKKDIRIKEINRELSRLSRAKDKLLDAYQEGECLTLKSLKERLKGLELKENALIKEKRSFEEFVTSEERRKNLKMQMEKLQGHLEKSEELSIEEKQNILRLLVSEIVITGQQIEVKHCIPCHGKKSDDFSPLWSARS
jgi:site-specific DNA recombinase